MQHLLGLTRPVATDAELVAAARGGDGAALGLLLERHRPRLFATAVRLVGYRSDAEDAVQETYLAAIRHIGSVRDPESVGAWLQAVVRRACLQHERRRRNGELPTDPLPELIDDRPGPEDRIERLELRDWIWGALHRLPEPLRVSAMLRYFGSYHSYDEVATILGVPIGTVRSRLSEARSSLPRRCSRAPRSSTTTFALGRARQRFWTDEFQDVFRRGERGRFVSHFATDLLIGWSGGRMARGREHHAALPGNAGFTRATRGTGEDPRASAVAQHGIGWAARSSSNERADHTGNCRGRATRDGGRRAMTANADRRTTAAPPTRSVHRTSLRLRWRNASGIVYALRL